MAGQKKDYNDLNRLRSLLSKSSRTISENNVEALNEYCFIGIPLLTMKIMKLLNTTNFYFYHKLCFGFLFSWLIFLSSSFCLCSRPRPIYPIKFTSNSIHFRPISSNQPGPPPPSFTSGELQPTFPACSEFFHPTLTPQKVHDLGIPSNLTLLCPVPERDRIEDINFNHIVIYEDSLEAGLRIPFHPLVCDFLDNYVYSSGPNTS